MVYIITEREMWGEAKDFTEAINKIETNPEDFQGGDKIVLVDFETKQTVFLKVKIGLQEY